MNIEYFRKVFGNWWGYIDYKELERVVDSLNIKYKESTILPNKQDVFKAFTYCNPNILRVIMVGQDPYPQRGIATGLAFANNTSNISPSLKVIRDTINEYAKSRGDLMPIIDNSLISWANQGVLLLNSALTVEENKPSSHSLLWRPFIKTFLRNMSLTRPDIIYVFFGKEAQSFIPYLSDFLYNPIVLKENHPSYYARTGIPMDYTIFKEIDNYTKQMNNDTIQWYIRGK
jgi:uracil-DNA glycosylase